KATVSKEEKKQLNKEIDILKNHPLLNKVFRESVEKARADDLLKADTLLNAIARPNLIRHLKARGVDTSKYTFK
ncbi:MAG TPA: hypothetical protein VE973_04040, partial [Candidatus Limnocylindria bacterium]|nr:hypothetical protein [Candidatus Limnocylindria bacterium]